ncbi:hypothetical protein [Mesorhizobium sp.]|uniref:hypothetical protein n=1 Tax=Mesorhizobium sp. TaxID=1871066 RepID=UPI000FE837A6|nr:hypothetical protein [Mesorhizobium sp.]RWM05644.1 MAG: hypothetical protein EOR71_23395 [Mesorhizobium sp.]
MTGKHHMLAVAVIYFIMGAVGIVSSLILLAAGAAPSLWNAFWSLCYVVGAYYFLRGSTVARTFLIIMSAIGAIAFITILSLSQGKTTFSLLLLFLGIGSAYCFHALKFSLPLNAEFDQRAASYRSETERAKQRFYDEMEGKGNGG